jgi:hypothetical protein
MQLPAQKHRQSGRAIAQSHAQGRAEAHPQWDARTQRSDPPGRPGHKDLATLTLNEVTVGEQTMQMLAAATPVQLRALQLLRISASV